MSSQRPSNNCFTFAPPIWLLPWAGETTQILSLKASSISESRCIEIPLYNTADGIFDSLTAASTPGWLHERNITHIISVGHCEPSPAHNLQSGYVIHSIPVKDESNEDPVIHFPAACRFIHNAMTAPNGMVLVHCVQGLSRSAAVVAAYCNSHTIAPKMRNNLFCICSDVVQAHVGPRCARHRSPRLEPFVQVS